MGMRFPRRRAMAAAVGQTAGTYPDDQARWSNRPALGDRACCCPARPVVRILIPPTVARPRSVDLLLCGHHFRTSCAARAAAGEMIVDDRRCEETGVNAHETREPAPADTTRRR